MKDTPKRPSGWKRGSRLLPVHFRTRGAHGLWEIFPEQGGRVRLTLTHDGKCLEEFLGDMAQAIRHRQAYDLRAEAKSAGRRAAQIDYDNLGKPISMQAAAGAPGLGKKA